jgi:hypothetical protein
VVPFYAEPLCTRPLRPRQVPHKSSVALRFCVCVCACVCARACERAHPGMRARSQLCCIQGVFIPAQHTAACVALPIRHTPACVA